jgi:dolichol-phosphate mannosyltransferase
MSGIYIIIPTYNEAENIEKLITKISDIDSDFQIIIVDDNSPDGTAELAQNINQFCGNIFVICRSGKLGIGSAILDGMKKALSFPNCEHIITMDADLSHDPKDIPRLLDEVDNADLVQGSRYIQGGRIVGWTLYRKFISRVANFLYRYLFNLSRHEITTYFRLYSRRCAEAIVQNVSTRSYEFALSSMLVAHDHGFKVKEVPIIFVNRVQGKSKTKIADIIQSVRYLILIFIIRLFKNTDIR